MGRVGSRHEAYIIAVVVVLMTGFLAPGVLRARLMAPPQPGTQVHAASQPQANRGFANRGAQ